ncbi:MAG: STAS domain-containing protein [Nevskiaceae bacterium]|jgi:ABC-type transporter Mla MlaB component|nr:STAS domain-containing protein [Nevskiaceae bacterium]
MAESVRLDAAGEGAYAISGPLTLGTCEWLWRQLQAGNALRTARRADLSGVDGADSAGLALLMAWRAACIAAGGDVQFEAVPQRLRLLAQLTGAEELLTN